MSSSASFSRRQHQVVRERLLAWFTCKKRDLPWRHNRNAYRVWVSELMLQQTRVDTVIGYYTRFLRRFPTLRSLALADLQEVLKVWEGLGYYSRARNMHRTAKILCENNQGRFPRSAHELLALPGIGSYTAAAIASLTWGEAVPVLDGNVIRVLSRLTACEDDVTRSAVKDKLRVLAQELLPANQAGDFNEAMMELGAMCCTPKKPQCSECPLQAVCRGYKDGCAESLPRKPKPRKVPHKQVGAAVLRNRKGEVMLAQRPVDRMLGGLWEFPGGTVEPGETITDCIRRELKEEMAIDIRVGDFLCTVRHAYSHFTIDLHAHDARNIRGRPRCIECSDYAWVPVEKICEYPLSKADLGILKVLLNSAAQ